MMRSEVMACQQKPFIYRHTPEGHVGINLDTTVLIDQSEIEPTTF